MKSEALSPFLRRFRIYARKPSKDSTASQSEADFFLYSDLLENVHQEPTNSFTTMPCRIHKQDDIAVAAAQRLSREWATMTNEAVELTGSLTYSPIGDIVSLVFPECLPERLDIIACMMELALLYDGRI
jgi:hypothetical protein